jgi:sulfatase maturation enzyme AslB (radical SAM superfamily)
MQQYRFYKRLKNAKLITNLSHEQNIAFINHAAHTGIYNRSFLNRMGTSRTCRSLTCHGYFNPATLKRCTECKAVRYCSKGCQRNHWPSHKSLCARNAAFTFGHSLRYKVLQLERELRSFLHTIP